MMKTKLINFELLYVYGCNDPDEIEKIKVKKIIDEIEIFSKLGYIHIVGLLLLDGFLYADRDRFFKSLKKIQNASEKMGIQKITLLAGMVPNFKKQLERHGLDFEIDFFDFNHWMVHRSYLNNLPADRWNHSNKFLFLGGVPSRLNRIFLLSKIYDRKLLKDSLWSFYPPWTDEDQKWCRSALSHYNDMEYHKFINQCENYIDQKYNDAKNYSRLDGTGLVDSKIYCTEWIYDPVFIDKEIFLNTTFSVVSEGNAYPPAHDYYFLTEKTWRAIINLHPFIIAGYPEQVKYAKEIGLDTFDDLFLHPDYYLVEDEVTRLELIVDNIEYFMNNYKFHIEKIQTKIDHNLSIFKAKVKNEIEHLSKYEHDDVETFFLKKGFSHLIQIPFLQNENSNP